jgi:hypothetical protein
MFWRSTRTSVAHSCFPGNYSFRSFRVFGENRYSRCANILEITTHTFLARIRVLTLLEPQRTVTWMANVREHHMRELSSWLAYVIYVTTNNREIRNGIQEPMNSHPPILDGSSHQGQTLTMLYTYRGRSSTSLSLIP